MGETAFSFRRALWPLHSYRWLVSFLAAVLCATAAESQPFENLWTSSAELADRPMSGRAWDAILIALENADPSEADVSQPGSQNNVYTLGTAIAYLRTGDPAQRQLVVETLENLVADGRPPGLILQWARKLGAYVLAAEMVGYRTPEFEAWVRNMAEVWESSDLITLREMFTVRPNNWGAMAFGSLTAAYAYLGDMTQLNEVRGYLMAGIVGPDPGYDEDQWGDRSWHCDPDNPLLINPSCVCGEAECGPGISIEKGGLIPADQRQAGPFTCEPPEGDIHTGGWMNGVTFGALILDRIGMGIWDVRGGALEEMILAHEVVNPQLQLNPSRDWILPIYEKVYGLTLTTGGRGMFFGPNGGFAAFTMGTAWIYGDDFETGDFSEWSSGSGLNPQ